MTKHLFSSGEVMYKKNQKNLAEGVLVGESIEYGDVESDTEYICIGKMGARDAEVIFALDETDYSDVKMKSTFKILMQSDLLNANWKSYHIRFND